MSATVNDFNLTYLGNGPSGAGAQIIADQTSGPKAKTLYGYGVLKAATTLGTTITSSNVGWIDGVASLGQKIVLQNIYKVDASDGTNSKYYSTGADNAFKAGDIVTVTGCSVAANNVSAVAVVSVASDSFVATNSTGTAETGIVATAIVNRGGIPKLVNVFVSPASTDTNGLATAVAVAATPGLIPSAITASGCVLNYRAMATSGNSVTIGFVLEFDS